MHSAYKYFLSYLSVDSKNSVQCPQERVIRTNCLDCLDRTNLVQSTVAYHCLTMALKPVLDEPPDDIKRLFKEGTASFLKVKLLIRIMAVWADNGDALSLQYAGTAALKADFTRFVFLHERFISNVKKNSKNWQAKR